ncbi:MAG: T9SS C-terminal target domain-containing protein [Flavobacteriia bacterium]|nr:T9SS C-terminal target domain-containing protein [Flavobacteriia bacterium]
MFYNENVSELPGELNLDAVTCYPNPSEGALLVDLGITPPAPIDVTVFNLAGQVVYEGKQFQQKQPYDFARLPKGNYRMQFGKTSKNKQLSFVIK